MAQGFENFWAENGFGIFQKVLRPEKKTVSFTIENQLAKFGRKQDYLCARLLIQVMH